MGSVRLAQEKVEAGTAIELLPFFSKDVVTRRSSTPMVGLAVCLFRRPDFRAMYLSPLLWTGPL
jgi:hypothetical protein